MTTLRRSASSARSAVAAVLAVGALATSSGLVVADTPAATGPSSSASPYLVPVAAGARTVSLLTVGDAVGPDDYQMVGIPDGLGAFDNGDGTFTVLMNHEIGTSAATNAPLGAVRAHGAAGAFVSRWTVEASSLAVVDGADLIDEVLTYDAGTWGPAPAGDFLNRLCSADLPARSAFYNSKSKQGYDGWIFMNGEESGTEGRAFGHLLDGTTYELPHLGKFSWENSVASPDTGNRTVVVGTDDTTDGEVYVYVGHKTKKGSPIDRAGLTNGALFGIKVDGVTAETNATGIGAAARRFDLVNHGDVSAWTGAQLQLADDAAGVTGWLRPEDGAWDPSNPDDFYFVTTNAFTANSRLWRLRFDNVKDPEAGGTVELLLDGSEGQHMFDNLTIDRSGHVLIQEDPGGQAYLARIWQYDIASDTSKVVAEHDPARFLAGAPGFLTIDEESSGIIDVGDLLGPGWFLLDVQAHYSIAGPLVQGGQLLALYNPDSDPDR